MADKISQLCDSIFAKAHELVDVGDFSSVAAAAEALASMARCARDLQGTPIAGYAVTAEPETGSPENLPPKKVVSAVSGEAQAAGSNAVPLCHHSEAASTDLSEFDRTSLKQVEAPCLDVKLDNIVSKLGYDDSDQDYLSQRWLTTDQAAKFAGTSADTIRNWCKSGSVFCERSQINQRRPWLVCPRSIALRLNNIPDPRLEN